MLRLSRKTKHKVVFPRAPKVAEVIRSCRMVYPNFLSGRLSAFFENETPDECIVILKGRMAAGIVMKGKYEKLMSFYLGRDVFSDKRVEMIMETRPLIVNPDDSIDSVFALMQERPEADRLDYAVVSDGINYLGVIPPASLIDKLNDFRLRISKYSNKLTGLPGSLLITEELDALQAEKMSFSLLHIDIDNFKKFNDAFGFSAGDEVISALAGIVESTAVYNVERGNYSFAGHIGGDDFVLITEPADSHKVCFEIISAFDRLSSGKKSSKTEEKLGISIGLLQNKGSIFADSATVMLSAARLLNEAKTYQGSVYVSGDGVAMDVNSLLNV